MAVASSTTQQQGRAPLADTLATWLYKRFGSGRTPRRTAWDLSTKADPVGGLVVSSYGLTQPVRTPRRFDTLAAEGYTQCPPVFRAVSIIASACAGIPWQLYARKTNTGNAGNGKQSSGTKGRSKHGEQIDQHALLDLLERPNPDTGGAKLMEAYVSYLYIAGNSYLWANRPGNGGKSGAPVELWTMRPDRMRVLPDAKQFVGGYTYEINGQRIDFSKPSVLHTKTFAPLDDWYGMSPLVVAARAIDIRNAGGDWNLALLQNSGKLPGFFVSKERLGDTQFERMREQLLDRYTGSRNVGLPGLLDGGDITWTPNGITPLDMDWTNLTREQGRDIAITLGVPAELLGDATQKTFSNFQEARASLYTETVLPLMDMIRDELNRWLVPMFGESLYLDYDREDIEALQEERGRLYQWVSKATFLTVNEQRDILGYPERPEADVIVVPLNSATLDEVMAGDAQRHVLPSTPVVPTGNEPPPASGIPQDTGGGDGNAAPTAGAPNAAIANDGGMASGVGGGAKANNVRPRQQPYDPLDDLLAGKVLTFHPKAPRRQPVRSGTGG